MNKCIFIDAKQYNINTKGDNYIYNHTIKCPFYANGLHLFDVENNMECLNNSLPIISGINNGYDGHYGNCDNQNLDILRSGMSVYDSLGSIIYNLINL
jgi:hypothetical protein